MQSIYNLDSVLINPTWQIVTIKKLYKEINMHTSLSTPFIKTLENLYTKVVTYKRV